MIKLNQGPLVLSEHGEVGAAPDYNSSISAAGELQVAVASGIYGIASTVNSKNIAIATGEHGNASALFKNSLAIGFGNTTKVKGVLGSYIAAASFQDGELSMVLKKVDGTNIEPNKWYQLANGELITTE